MITMQTRGIKKANALLNSLAGINAAWRGIYYKTEHENGLEAGQLISYLAEDNRDLRPSEKAEADKAGKAYVRTVELELAKWKGQQRPMGAAMARSISAKAYRNAGIEILKIMSHRAKNNLTVGNAGAPKVSDAYAKWRQRKYSVSIAEIYKRKGILMQRINPAAIDAVSRFTLIP